MNLEVLRALKEGKMNESTLAFMKKQNQLEKNISIKEKKPVVDRNIDRINEAENILKNNKEYYFQSKEDKKVPDNVLNLLLQGKSGEAKKLYEQGLIKKTVKTKPLNENVEKKVEQTSNVSKDEIKDIVYKMLENYDKERLKPIFKEIFMDILKDMKKNKK